jgi:hypothetical protein
MGQKMKENLFWNFLIKKIVVSHWNRMIIRDVLVRTENNIDKVSDDKQS